MYNGAGSLNRASYGQSRLCHVIYSNLCFCVHVLQTVYNCKMTNQTFAELLRQKIWNNQTHSNASYYGNFQLEKDHGTSHLSILSPDGDAVALTSTINF